MADDLTLQQQRFAELVLAGENATDAYIQAGYKVKHKSTAASAASRLLTNVKVATHIERIKRKSSEKSSVTRAGVLDAIDGILKDPSISAVDRLDAGRMLLEELRKYAPIETPIEVLDTEATVAEVAVIGLSLMKAAAAGLMAPEMARDILKLGHMLSETIVSARVALIAANADPDQALIISPDAAPAQAAEPAAEQPKQSRPKWLKGPSSGGEGAK